MHNLEQTVPGSPLGALLPSSGLFSMPLQIDIEGSTKARGTGAATAAYLKSMTLTITAPSGATFAFLDGSRTQAHATVPCPGHRGRHS